MTQSSSTLVVTRGSELAVLGADSGNSSEEEEEEVEDEEAAWRVGAAADAGFSSFIALSLLLLRVRICSVIIQLLM